METNCPVCGWSLGRKPIVRIIQEVEWRFCCFGCASTQYLVLLLQARGKETGEAKEEGR